MTTVIFCYSQLTFPRHPSRTDNHEQFCASGCLQLAGASQHAQILAVGMQREEGRTEPTEACQGHNWSCTSCQHLGKTTCENLSSLTSENVLFKERLLVKERALNTF